MQTFSHQTMKSPRNMWNFYIFLQNDLKNFHLLKMSKKISRQHWKGLKSSLE